jgi:cytochrome c-type biogenesis protein CcmE
MNTKVLLAIGLLVAAVVIGVTSFKKTMTPYIGFAEAQFLRFSLKDTKGDVMPVVYRGVIPGNFDQAVSIVAIGQYQGDHFEASQLLVKCPSKYQAEAEKGARHPEGVSKQGVTS